MDAGTVKAVIMDSQETYEWMESAECLNSNPDIFFTEKGEDNILARAMCDACVVIEPCLQYALDTKERFGVWGSCGERERRYIRRLGVMGMDYLIGKENGTYKYNRRRGRPSGTR